VVRGSWSFGRGRALSAGLKVLALRLILAAWPRNRNRLSRRRQSRLAWHPRPNFTVKFGLEARDEATAIEKAAAEFKVLAKRLMAVRQ
jgi:hypothetical protein